MMVVGLVKFVDIYCILGIVFKYCICRFFGFKWFGFIFNSVVVCWLGIIMVFRWF